MWGVLASIPYTTFPDIDLGPLTLRTFGLMVALGVLIGARLGSDYGERFGVNREDTYRTGTLMVLAGIVGSRLTWAVTHTESIDSPLDIIAIWQGGIQFSGGFIAALIVGIPMFRKWTKVQRWHVLNGYAWGLAIGVAIGRIGCYAVGEHFGRTTDFFLGTRYDGGEVREPTLGDVPLVEGTVFHNTALYEGLLMFGLFLVMGAIILRARRKKVEVLPGTLVAVFMLWAGISRFGTDALRVNDERVAGMTGAQWMSLVMVPYGLYVLFRIRPMLRKLVGPDGKALDDAPSGSLLDTTDDADVDDKDKTVPDELAAPDNGKAESDADSESDDSESSGENAPSDPKVTSEAEPEATTKVAKSEDGDSADDEVAAESTPKPKPASKATGNRATAEPEPKAKPKVASTTEAAAGEESPDVDPGRATTGSEVEAETDASNGDDEKSVTPEATDGDTETEATDAGNDEAPKARSRFRGRSKTKAATGDS
jgi:phosphatidylglycerol:prolipoprotein diacylglycerol transferase